MLMTQEERIRLMKEASFKAAVMVEEATPASRSADFLYDEDGMPS